MSPLPCQARKTQSSADVSKGSVQIANHLDYDSRDQKSQARALLIRSQLTMRGTSAPQNIPVPKSPSACLSRVRGKNWLLKRFQTQGPAARTLLSLIWSTWHFHLTQSFSRQGHCIPQSLHDLGLNALHGQNLADTAQHKGKQVNFLGGSLGSRWLSWMDCLDGHWPRKCPKTACWNPHQRHNHVVPRG